MSKRTHIFIGILLAYALGVRALMYRQLGDIDPRYRESAEESLVETAQLLAVLDEGASRDGALQTETLGPLFQSRYARRFTADIFGFEKTRVELGLTVVDRAGRVVFDSMNRHLGAEHSQWHDIHLALQGEYGARTSRDVDGDPKTSVMFVAAPVRDVASGGDRIIGAVSVGKPVQSFGQFVEAARRKTLLVGAALRRDRRLRSLRARAAQFQPAAPGPASARCGLRRDARRARWPQLHGRLRADADARSEEPAVGDPRRRRTVAGTDG